MLQFFKHLFSDSEQISFLRVISFILIISITIVFIVKNCITQNFIDIPPESAYILMSILGAKVGQKFVESASKLKQKQLDDE